MDRGRKTRNGTWDCFCVIESGPKRFPNAVETFIVIAGVGSTTVGAVGEAMDCLLGAAADGGRYGSPCRIEEIGRES